MADFNGKIKVASRIVDYLSSGLYESPSACLKELINNSYDADASIVHVFIKPDADRILILDDGEGLNQTEFEKHFNTISESHKREVSDQTPLGRPKIGKIGIGFIAANELCDVLEIVSTKQGSSDLLEVSISFEMMRQDPEVRRSSDDHEFNKADYRGTTKPTAAIEEHYTHVILKKLRGEVRNVLVGQGSTRQSVGQKTLYGLSPASVRTSLIDPGLRTWADFDAYSRNLLEIGLNVPVRYHDNWIDKRKRETLKQMIKSVNRLGFRVYVDGAEILKPVAFRPQKESILEKFEFEGEHVSVRGYMYAQNSGIKPIELQGAAIRIRNAAVGDYDTSFLSFSQSIGPLLQRWISCEIWADDRLEEAMNIDRRTLRVSHPAYVELQRNLHNDLSDFISRVRNEIYGSGSEKRAGQRAQSIRHHLDLLEESRQDENTREVLRELSTDWEAARDDDRLRKRILRKYTVDELYEVILEVAEQLLDQSTLRAFVKGITKRLQQ